MVCVYSFIPKRDGNRQIPRAHWTDSLKTQCAPDSVRDRALKNKTEKNRGGHLKSPPVSTCMCIYIQMCVYTMCASRLVPTQANDILLYIIINTIKNLTEMRNPSVTCAHGFWLFTLMVQGAPGLLSLTSPGLPGLPPHRLVFKAGQEV